MKKILLTITAIVYVFIATAQNHELTNRRGIPMLPTAGAFAFGIDATPILGGIFGGSETVLPRFDGATFFGKYFPMDNRAHRFGVSLNYINIRDTVLGVDAGAIIGLSYGLERRFGSTRLQGFFGGQAELGVLAVRDYTTTFILHPNVFVGAEYFVAPGVSIGGHVGWGIFFGRESFDNEATSIFGFGNFGAGITLMFHFNRRQERNVLAQPARHIPVVQQGLPPAVSPPPAVQDDPQVESAEQDLTQIIPQVQSVQFCNERQPGWGESLGTISFATDSTWRVGSQIWSDAVTATNCQKTTYDAGSTRYFNADCRSNPYFPGDLFSWCAVVRFAEFLCPHPWRVPTQQDFASLDKELGGDGRRVQYNRILVNRYLNDWGAVYGGFVNFQGAKQTRRNTAMYWSQTESNATNAISLDIRTSEIRSQFPFSKGGGLSLRCVKN